MKQNEKKKILIVDDSEMVRNFHTYILKMFGYQVGTAENGAVALEKLLTGDYHLLVTDINMPKMDGYELIRNVHAQGIDIPIIIVSTEEEYKVSDCGINKDPGIHMVKPTDPEKLVSTVRRLL
ncbi:response regulator [Petroclostridium sp. X23]|uniref:response regulator n=1 Tax=Petroclostridium sp. X23 TaxID=3045146 RepID=UPI0024AE7EF8|nr:response regulator [Petroclostridium sp. X23]WHH61361.1 response regulator [Petroclostridium sp. X23]